MHRWWSKAARDPVTRADLSNRPADDTIAAAEAPGSMLVTLLHLLMFVYWLGGDLGAFCASYYATDPRRSVAERALALRLINVVDTAPTVALVLALPTGLALATARGWIGWSWVAVGGVGLACLAWLGLALSVHLRPGPATARLAAIERTIRVLVIATLTAVGAAGVARAAGATLPFAAPPLFIALKLWLLAGCTALGLAVRPPLRTFVAAFGELTRAGSTPAIERALASSMSECRRYVLGIWACVLGAALFGLWKPL